MGLLTDVGLQNLQTCHELKILKINGMNEKITDEGICELLLHHLPSLHTIETKHTSTITPEGLTTIVRSKSAEERIVLTKEYIQHKKTKDKTKDKTKNKTKNKTKKNPKKKRKIL